MAGNYRIGIGDVSPYEITGKDVGSDNVDSDFDPFSRLSDQISLVANQVVNNIDGGIYRRGTIGDFVWNDTDKNGIQEAGEPGVGNVSVRLHGCGGGELAATVTDARGYFSFEGIPAGDYALRFLAPEGCVFTSPFSGSDREADSDADPATGLTGCFTLTSGRYLFGLDAGLRPAGSPVLNLLPGSRAKLILQWAGKPGLRLQRTPSLDPPAWTNVPGTLGQSSTEVPNTGSQAFFRLAWQ